ncbi:MAG: hypothetical protein KDB18_03740, partial [Salinibacterium sp.]|nr:hypothetical protein [Salinibacterium sp.]
MDRLPAPALCAEVEAGRAPLLIDAAASIELNLRCLSARYGDLTGPAPREQPPDELEHEALAQTVVAGEHV